jgi:hypothetical protein
MELRAIRRNGLCARSLYWKWHPPWTVHQSILHVGGRSSPWLQSGSITYHSFRNSGGRRPGKDLLSGDGALGRAAKIIDALAARFPDRIVTCHGGAIESPGDFTGFLQAEPRLHGYVGGSSAERFPIESSVTQAAREFRGIRLEARRVSSPPYILIFADHG